MNIDCRKPKANLYPINELIHQKGELAPQGKAKGSVEQSICIILQVTENIRKGEETMYDGNIFL